MRWIPQGSYNNRNWKIILWANKFKLFKEKTWKTKSSIPEDESQSFADMLLQYDNEKPDLRNI